MAKDTATARVMRAIGEATAARDEGRPADGLPRLRAVEALVDDRDLEREVAVAMLRERALCHLALQETGPARLALQEAMDISGSNGSLVDPLRALIATLELMAGDAQASQAILADRGQDRRATLVSQARLHLYEDATDLALEVLRVAEMAPGGISDLHPPTAALRSLVAIWEGRLDQARMLYEGVATDQSPWWELARLLLLRSRWVQTGDGRYLSLALGTAEQLRFSAPESVPGMRAAAAAQHAVILTLSGQTSMALEAADEALEELGDLGLPEWPNQAILRDLEVVYRDGGAQDRLTRVRALHTDASAVWDERMQAVTGPRGPRGLGSSEEGSTGFVDLVRVISQQLGEGHPDPVQAFLRAIAGHLEAKGVRWTDVDGQVLGLSGVVAVDIDKRTLVSLGAHGELEILGAQREASIHLDVRTLLPLASLAKVVGASTERQMNLLQAVDDAQARTREAREELEVSRRGPLAAIIGGHFPTVAGRCPAVRSTLDRLSILSDSAVPVLLEGPTGSGRRHLAKAYAQHLGHRMDSCVILDVKLVPAPQMRETLARLVTQMGPGVLVVANAEALAPEAASWLICHGQTDEVPGRLVITLDSGARGAIPEALRRAFGAGHVKMPSLSQRLEDFDLIVNSVLRRLGGRPEQVSSSARALLSKRSWPGEVAELRETLARAVTRARGESILPEYLSEEDVPLTRTSLSESLDLGYQGAVRVFRRDLLRHALETTGGNRTHAAELLGVQRTYFMRLIRELGADDIPPVG